MFNKSLPLIIFNKWTFIDLMSNLMVVCATWKVNSWNSIHTMNFFAPIPWNSSNNASTLVIKFEFIIPYFDSHKYTFCYCWFCFWQHYRFLFSYKYRLNFSKHFDALSCGFLLNHIMNLRFKILSSFFKLFIFMFFWIVKR